MQIYYLYSYFIEYNPRVRRHQTPNIFVIRPMKHPREAPMAIPIVSLFLFLRGKTERRVIEPSKDANSEKRTESTRQH